MRSLAEQALDNVIDQFARPLDFLRELVQNALDAGSSRIDVAAYRTETGVRITVSDSGHGMDRSIIDGQLTKLFASEKHGDFTQIGRFGIGFASVFALRPESVVVRTGRLDEAWEIRFESDQRFRVIAVDPPVTGTTITLDKALVPDAADRLVREAEWVLQYWCEHTERPIVFRNTPPGDAPSPATDDPFAAFARPAVVEQTISRPLSIDGDIQRRISRHGLTVLVTCSDRPRYAFYSHGLTLVNTEDPRVLGPSAQRLQHLSIKVAGEGLAHTLTRDNVVQDDMHARSMSLAVGLAESLLEPLIERTAQAAANGETDTEALRWLTTELAARDEPSLPTDVPLFVDGRGAPRTLAEVQAQENELAVILVADADCGVARAVEAAGHFVLRDGPEVRALLTALPRERLMGLLPRLRTLRHARERYWTPRIRDAASLPPVEQDVLVHLNRLAAAIGWSRVALGDFGTLHDATHEPIVVARPSDEALVLRQLDTPFRGDALINRNHPIARAQLAAWHDTPATVAMAWLQASLTHLRAPDQLQETLFQASVS